MANHKSALKRDKQNKKRYLRNKAVKTRMKNAVKDLRLGEDEKSKEVILSSLDATKSVIDKAAKKGVIHKNTAARKIARLSKFVNAITA
ncbi:MAG: 30S ribosomal protein S20 [Deltaproteobacteria bacterium]|nr:30S ribosomal protein S20 [Deltaproteobacteria bacterium]MBW2011841.1 30S ribosomal protein S20 [Deltaproteobacteria bacterium]MBW2100173.1 30S ribosomal protein S20 [Deltaproteobacteria bacterium]